MKKLAYHADQIAADTTEYGADYVVHSVHFGTGDPEADGHHWNFSRCFADDEGVCTVREIQQATLYEGIRSLQAWRNGLRCIFEPSAVDETGFSELTISFEVDDLQWKELAEMLDTVFRDKPYYQRADSLNMPPPGTNRIRRGPDGPPAAGPEVSKF